jgi:outer membrane lipoprotein-sorting protein
MRPLPSPLSKLLLAVGLPLCAVALAAPTASGIKASPTSPSVEEIIERNVSARGGLEAWRKVGTMIWAGHIESAHAPAPSMRFTLAQQRPNKTRFEIDALGQKTVRVFDGARGWKVRPGHNDVAADAQPYSTEEMKFARAGQGIDGPLIDFHTKGNMVSLAGLDEIEGGKAYRLEVRLLTGGERDSVWIDAKTFLEIRCDRIVDGPGPAGVPRKVVSMRYRDYKSFEGLKIASIIETSGDAQRPPDRMVIEKVLVNPPIDAYAFMDPVTRHPHRQGLPVSAGEPE